MTHFRFWIAAAGIILSAGAGPAAVAQQSSALSAAVPGLWELTGIPGARRPVHQCVANLSALAEYEHRAGSCAAAKTLTDSGKVAVLYYTCPGSDFGRTSIKVVTPRDLKVDTQGISDGLPFAYAFEARRLGECKAAGGNAGSERGR